MNPPHVIYSIGSRFGTTDSLGLVSDQAVCALDQAGYLHRLLVSSVNSKAARPNAPTHQLGLLHRALRRVAVYDGHNLVGWLADVVFDAWASTQLSNGTHLHVWGQGALYSLRQAKQHGQITFLERASSHMLTQQRLLRDEYTRFGLTHPPTPQGAINRAIHEFDLADYVVVPSEFVRQSFLEHGFPPNKLRLLPFGVDVQRFQPTTKEPVTFRAVFAGQVSLRKGIQYLLEAWKRLNWSDAELQVIGSLQPDAAQVVARYRELRTLQWVKYVPNLADYLQQASVFIFPTIEEGSALVTYMALACGLPTITTPNAGSVIRNGEDGLLVPIRDVDALCERLERLRTEATLRHTLRRAARNRAEQFTWADYRHRFINLYDCLGS